MSMKPHTFSGFSLLACGEGTNPEHPSALCSHQASPGCLWEADSCQGSRPGNGYRVPGGKEEELGLSGGQGHVQKGEAVTKP